MFGYNPPVEVAYFEKVGYGRVTAPISLHQPGQISFWGRYYSAELLNPRPTELKIGTYVLVFGERGFSLVVEKDEAIDQEE
jgi:hypothetical protein